MDDDTMGFERVTIETNNGAETSEPVRPPRQRGKTLTPNTRFARRDLDIARRENKLDAALFEANPRPKTRGECENREPGPCPFVSCRFHLYLDVNPKSGAIKLNFPHLEVWQLEQTCALDVADNGDQTLDHVGELLNMTRERIRQLETAALDKMREARAEQLADLADSLEILNTDDALDRLDEYRDQSKARRRHLTVLR